MTVVGYGESHASTFAFTVARLVEIPPPAENTLMMKRKSGKPRPYGWLKVRLFLHVVTAPHGEPWISSVQYRL